MAKIQARNGVKGKTYRVEFMRDGGRVSKSFKLKKEAEKFAAHITVNEDLAFSLSSYQLNTLTMQKAVAEYCEQYQGRNHSLPVMMSWWADFIGQETTIGKANRRHVKEAMRHLSEKGFAPATLNRYKAALSALFTYLCDAYDLKHNPAREVRQQKENNARVRFLSNAEITRLLSAAKESSWERLYLLILMAITTGVRRSNLIEMRWSDINLQTRTAYIERTKNGEAKTISLTKEVIEELMKFRQVGKACLFPHPSDPATPLIHFDSHWQKARKVAGIVDFRFHDLRHSCASLLAMNGASLLEIADILGHKTISMTQRYSHLCHQHKAALTDRVFSNIATG